MRGTRVKALRTVERPHPGRKHGGTHAPLPTERIRGEYRAERKARQSDWARTIRALRRGVAPGGHTTRTRG